MCKCNERDYTDEDVRKLQGSVRIRHTLAELGSQRLWKPLHERSEGRPSSSRYSSPRSSVLIRIAFSRYRSSR